MILNPTRLRSTDQQSWQYKIKHNWPRWLPQFAPNKSCLIVHKRKHLLSVI